MSDEHSSDKSVQRHPELSRKSRDRTGERFGKLVAVEPVERRHDSWLWWYKCDCGGEKITWPQAAKRAGHCGCETESRLSARCVTHGLSAARLYKVWFAMKDRCRNPKHTNYNRYGGRGIRVCDRWESSFESFLSDMGYRPTPKHTIERIDNDGNYEPSNCRWATRKEQQSNRQDSRLVTVAGVTRTMMQWSEAVGIPYETIRGRIQRGWDPAAAVFEPVQTKMRNGRCQTSTTP